jgi:hypothetical protein
MNKLAVDRDMARLAYLFSMMTGDMTDGQLEEENILIGRLTSDNTLRGFPYGWAQRWSTKIRRNRAQYGGD